jgi:hypothetical protein
MPPKMASVTKPVSTSKRSVSVQGDTVVKIQDPDSSRRERLRTGAGGAVGQHSGLFVVPDILSYDDDRGEIVFRRLNLTGLRQVLSRSKGSAQLIARAAKSLAAIHTQMEPMEGGAGTPESNWAPAGNRLVPLHGDFCMRNLFYLEESDGIAIIDWSNAGWIDYEGDLGCPEIDVAVFLMSFFNRRLFGPWPVPHRHDLARHFLTTYASASVLGLDLATLARIVSATTANYQRQTRRRAGYLGALGYRHNALDLARFLRRFDGECLVNPRIHSTD